MSAQDTKQQIIWLQQTLSNGLKPASSKYTNVMLKNVDECNIVIGYKYKTEEYITTLPTNIKSMPDVGGFLPTGSNGRGFMYEGKQIHTRNISTGKEYHHKFFGSAKFLVDSSEKDLYKKVEEKIKQLGASCNKK